MNLEVGMYCYNKTNRKLGIGQIISFQSNNNVNVRYKNDIELVNIGNIIANHNIIDLIEVGDYVNGYKVVSKGTVSSESINVYLEILTKNLKNFWNNKIFERDIKTILTHEQFENNCYKIGDE